MINATRRASLLGSTAMLGLATTLAAGITTVSAAESRAAPAGNTVAKTSHLKGWARMYFPTPDNDIQVTVDAHATFDPRGAWRPTRSWGTFRISHRLKLPDGTWFTNWGDLKVDCLTTGGPTATVTGTLTRITPRGPWEEMLKEHARMGISFYIAQRGAGPSRIGLSGGPLPGEGHLSTCMAPAADAPLIRGGYTLIDKR
ncbi:hypothetical protein [Actinomadura verrucosospora]|uniref:Uncharacterized protein n=1 Tax=Actinomadura verrucosospora TaxID=46165 RepID=A0A7D3VSV9_ACTVE|nr:hypothetical protein [Actinomadura verrucosospora]QKG20054.1 hypothetical protein ACTIVE_1690 [Actinomadura verrucosospora]